ncbi:hypothetical protein J6590_026018 [Homalodisca vitripennis]|nr:hypothetical protein J6590_026018 [Homalodisca vitripennis]
MSHGSQAGQRRSDDDFACTRMSLAHDELRLECLSNSAKDLLFPHHDGNLRQGQLSSVTRLRDSEPYCRDEGVRGKGTSSPLHSPPALVSRPAHTATGDTNTTILHGKLELSLLSSLGNVRSHDEGMPFA